MSARLAAAVLGIALLLGCRRGASTAGASSDAESEAPASPAATIAPSRCRPSGPGVTVPDHEDLELGDATASFGGVAIGLGYGAHAGRAAAVGLMTADVQSLRVVELGPTLGDAQPPRLAARGAELLAAAYVAPSHGDARDLRVFSLAGKGDVKTLGTVAEPRDDSLAFDLAPGLLVWDESTTGSGAHGIVRAAAVPASPEAPLGPTRDVSPPGSDADTPRVVAAGAKTFVLWIARRPELDAGTVDATALAEITGEPRAFSWLELVVVDASGTPIGPMRRLTSTSGHVTAYDVQAQTWDARPAVLVVARDQGESVDGSGGALLRVRAREDAAEPAIALPTDGLGRGAPMLIDAPTPWLAWADAHETLRLLPLDAAGAPAGLSSLEPSLEDKSPILALAGSERLLVSAPSDSTTQVQVFACTR